MHKAAYDGDLQLLNLLHKYGAEVIGNDSALRTPFFYACHASEKVSRDDWIAVVRAFLKFQASISYTDIVGGTALQSAMRLESREESIMRTLLAKDADVHHKNSQNESIFETAILHAPPPVLRLLTEHGLDLEEEDANGCTPLLRRPTSTDTSEGRKEILIASGANPCVQDHYDRTTLLAATNTKRSAFTTECLLKAGASMNIRDSSGQSAVDIAVRHDSLEVGQITIRSDIDLHVSDSRWEPALIRQIRHASENMVRTLLASGVDPNTLHNGFLSKSALTCAVTFDRQKIAKILIEKGAMIRRSGSSAQCDPFYWAIVIGRHSMLKLLLELLSPIEEEKGRIAYLWNYTGRWDSENKCGRADKQEIRIVTELLINFRIPQPRQG